MGCDAGLMGVPFLNFRDSVLVSRSSAKLSSFQLLLTQT